MGINRHEGVIKYLAWHENRFEADLNSLFLKTELFYLTGPSSASGWLNFRASNFSLPGNKSGYWPFKARFRYLL
jgi:hypothetical protein